MALLSYLKSTILSKVVMAVTGIILVLYIVVHTLGNLLIYFGRDSINSYSEFLHSLGPLLWIIRAALLLAVVLHIVTSVYLKFYNLGAKPKKYAVKNYVKAKLTSRTMIWTGIMVGCFVVYHVMHLTLGVTNPETFKKSEKADYYEKHADFLVQNNVFGTVVYEKSKYVSIPEAKVLFRRNDVYKMVVTGFRNPYISVLYIIAVAIVGFHLNHAIQSMFQTLGYNQRNYFPAIVKWSTALSYIIALCLISIPVTILLGLVGGKL